MLLLLALPWASGEKALPSAKVLGDRQGLCMMLSGSEEDTSVHGPSEGCHPSKWAWHWECWHSLDRWSVLPLPPLCARDAMTPSCSPAFNSGEAKRHRPPRTLHRERGQFLPKPYWSRAGRKRAPPGQSGRLKIGGPLREGGIEGGQASLGSQAQVTRVAAGSWGGTGERDRVEGSRRSPSRLRRLFGGLCRPDVTLG